MGHLPAGCPFAARCGFVFDACRTVHPSLVTPVVPGDDTSRLVACLRHDPSAVAAAGAGPVPVPESLAVR